MGDATATGKAVGGDLEKRPRGEALEIALAADLEVVKGHAQWGSPELEPQVGAHQYSLVGCVDGAESA